MFYHLNSSKTANAMINLAEIAMIDYKSSIDSSSFFNYTDWEDKEIDKEEVLYKVKIHFKNGFIFEVTLAGYEFIAFSDHLK